MCVVECEAEKEGLVTSPFTDESPVEVPLSRAPLVKVLAQIKFPVNAKIDTVEGVAGFQEALRGDYPVMRQEQQMPPAIAPGLPFAIGFGLVWRLSTMDDGWTVVLARDFVALETSEYTTRVDFLHRLGTVLEALVAADLAPVVTDRLGVRYIDRIEGDDMLEDLSLLVRPEVLGVGEVELPEGSEMIVSAAQTHLRVDGMEIRANWGQLPPNAAMLPGLDVVDVPSWVFDVDVYAEKSKPFSIDDVLAEAKQAAEHAYALFRWAVTPEFLRRHGGEV
jgi:uncharacterized protein (TIGR04255 family)